MNVAAKMDRAGRLLLPQRFRTELGLGEGSEVLLRVEDGEIRLTTRSAALKKAQAAMQAFKPADSVVDSFLADRRAEALRENL